MQLVKHINVKHAAHAVMLAFMLASLANVKDFFQHLHGDPIVAWGLGIALGFGLVVMAGLLSAMTWDWSDPRFQAVAAIAGALALLSGGIQAAAYAQHMNKIAAVIVGLALPLVGELGVALAVSAYQQAIRRQRMVDAQSQLADGVRGQIGDAIAAIDRSKIEAQVNRAATLVTKAIVDSTITDMLEDINRNRKTLADQVGEGAIDPTTATTFDPENDDITTSPSPKLPPTVDQLNAARRRKVVERREAITQLIESYGPMGAPELCEKLLNDRDIKASAQTIRDDCNALVSESRLVTAGRKWDIPHTITVALPQLAQPVLNGHAHE